MESDEVNPKEYECLVYDIYDWAIWAERYEDDRAAVLPKMKRAFQNAMNRYLVRPRQLMQCGFSVSTNPQRHRIWLVSVEMQSGQTEETFAEWWMLNVIKEDNTNGL